MVEQSEGGQKAVKPAVSADGMTYEYDLRRPKRAAW